MKKIYSITDENGICIETDLWYWKEKIKKLIEEKELSEKEVVELLLNQVDTEERTTYSLVGICSSGHI